MAPKSRRKIDKNIQNMTYHPFTYQDFLDVSNSSGYFDFFGAGYFASEPLSLAIDTFGEPAFFISPSFYCARALYFVAGIALIMISVRLSGKKARKA